jgi:hypothetical protein
MCGSFQRSRGRRGSPEHHDKGFGKAGAVAFELFLAVLRAPKFALLKHHAS